MDFLKDLFGDAALTFADFEKATKAKEMNLVNLKDGGYVSAEKATRYKTERDDYKKQLDDANTKIGEFEKLDVDEIKRQVSDWKTKYENLEADKQKAEYRRGLENLAAQEKFSSAAAKKAFIHDLEKQELKFKNDKLIGYDDFKETYAESDPGAFVLDGQHPTRVNVRGSQGGGTPAGQVTLAEFRAMKFKDRMKLHGESPDEYKKLSDAVKQEQRG